MNSRKKSVSIIGCGWLGYPLAKKLIAQNWQVKGSTTTVKKVEMLMADGIEAYLLLFPLKSEIDTQLLKSENLIINFPPGRNNSNHSSYYSASIKKIIERASALNMTRKIIFISSTSVYGSDHDIIDESSPCYPRSESGKKILRGETLIRNSDIPHVILRFGGLAGPDRHPGRFLAGKTGLITGKQAVNFLHHEDAINIIIYMMNHTIENDTFNVVAPIHPDKEQFYMKMTSGINLVPPVFVKGTDMAKREVSIDKLTQVTDFKFSYPDPMSFKF